LRWVLHVNPFRRAEDAELLAHGLALAGLAVDPDERRGAAEPTQLQQVAQVAPRPVFRRQGELWTLAFDGVSVQLTEAKGFQDLAQLFARPEASIHCLELGGRLAEPSADAPVFDERARHELGARLRELQETIDEADALHDRGRAEAARAELDQIGAALSGALGLGGRSRRLGSAAERARSAVTWRIRNAIRKIAAVHPSLGRHLDNAVRTGAFCSYSPEKPVEWTL
jgi:hypothetical protein